MRTLLARLPAQTQIVSRFRTNTSQARSTRVAHDPSRCLYGRIEAILQCNLPPRKDSTHNDYKPPSLLHVTLTNPGLARQGKERRAEVVERLPEPNVAANISRATRKFEHNVDRKLDTFRSERGTDRNECSGKHACTKGKQC